MKKRQNNFTISKMFCCVCGQEGVPISRNPGSYREPGHLKKLYCIHCKKESNHVEIRPIYNDYNYNDFQLEMKYHNFDENGNRKEPYRIFRGHLKQKGII